MSQTKKQSSSGVQLISAVFRDGATIPQQYTCRGQNVNPPLNMFNIPEGTKSLALIMHDPDAVSGDFVHWLVWDISPSTETINANSVPIGAIQGLNGAGRKGYTGPCPPSGTGTHHYIFNLYALNKSLGLSDSADRRQLENAMKDHIIDQTRLTGLFSAQN